MENPMPCTGRTLMTTLCLAVDILQLLEAVWALGSVPKPTGEKKQHKNPPDKKVKIMEKVPKAAERTAAERNFRFLGFGRLCQRLLLSYRMFSVHFICK